MSADTVAKLIYDAFSDKLNMSIEGNVLTIISPAIGNHHISSLVDGTGSCTIEKSETRGSIIWTDALGNPSDAKTSGTTAERPTNIKAGFFYMDTTLNKPIWFNGTAWVDATGATV